MPTTQSKPGEVEMSVEDELKMLKARRGSIKGRLTKFKSYLDSLTVLETVSSLETKQLSMKISRMQSLFTNFDEVQGQIEILSELDQAEELSNRDKFEQEFDTNLSIAQDFLEANSPPRDSLNNTNCSLQCHHDNSDVLGFRLPVIKIQNFDGSCFKWLEFKETYTSLVHNNAKIQNIHKFHYLLSYLEGEAARVLCNLEVSDSNYSEAWQLLCKRYDNKRQLINNHLKALFSIESVRETDKSLRFIVDHITKNLRALCTLGLPADKWDVLIIYMVSSKLDGSTCYKWEEHRNTLPEIPTLNDFFDFLIARADVLETVYRQRHDKTKNLPPPPQSKPQTKTFALTTKPNSPHSFKPLSECIFCKGHHLLYECAAFKAKRPEDRVALASSLNLCENCLRVGHKVQTCRLPGSCRSCKQRHNSLLHVPNQSDVTCQPEVSNTSSTSLAAMTNSDVLLCTAQVQLKNPATNDSMIVRCLLDSGSQSTIVSQKVQQTLNLASQPSNVSIVGLSDTPINTHTKRCALHFQSLNDPFNVNMTCLVVPKIAEKLPKVSLDVSRYDLSKFQLADPKFYEASSIDMLIGADLFWDLIGTHQHSLGPRDPILRSSKLGWLVSGPLPILNHSKPQSSNKTTHCNFLLQEPNLPNLNDELTKFWELENIPHKSLPYTQEEKICEQHFLSNTYRLTNGRYCVRLPLRDEKECLGESYSLAKKRFISLEARFRSQPEPSWPVSSSEVIDLPELKALPALVVESAPAAAFIDIERFSKLTRAQRVCAQVHRFIHNVRNPQNKLTGILTVDELKCALTTLIRLAQQVSFPNEVLCLNNKKPLPHKSNLISLNPFIDDQGLVRVGGRINNANYPYDKKHPILLKANHYLTKLIFQQEHERMLHAPPQLLLATVRDQYWPVGGRKLARDTYDRCFKCRRFKGEGMVNIMSNLPNDRVEPDFPFNTVATDFAGPYLITDRKGRGCKITKCYLCIFVCFRYKCIHLEPVSELTKNAFILTLTRFIARRGKPRLIFCDNGRNYVAGAKEINNFFKLNKTSICDFAAQRGIEFKFSPAYSPHFNGLAEAGVRSAKFHIRRILGQTHLTFEELASLFAQIEAILNSRPLCPLSPSPNDFQPLTPGHLLIGRPLTSLPTPSFTDVETSRLNRFQRLEQFRQHFWKRWSKEYVAELQQRTKWRVTCKQLQLDDLVLIKEDTPPLYWRLGRVSKLFPGPDGVPRVADVKTAHGTIRRALNRLCLLPSPENEA